MPEVGQLIPKPVPVPRPLPGQLVPEPIQRPLVGGTIPISSRFLQLGLEDIPAEEARRRVIERYLETERLFAGGLLGKPGGEGLEIPGGPGGVELGIPISPTRTIDPVQELYQRYFREYQAQRPGEGLRRPTMPTGRSRAYMDYLRGSVY